MHDPKNPRGRRRGGPDHGGQKIVCNSWALWGKSLVYREWDGESHLERFDLETRRVDRFFFLEREQGFWSGFTVSPDSRWVVVSLTVPQTSDLMLVEGFR